MRLPVTVLASLAILFLLPMTAQAQSSSQLTITMQAPDEILTSEAPSLTLPGATTFTGDAGTYALYPSGIPIHYVVTKAPAWATVTVSPSSDVIPVPTTPGLTVTAVRSFQLTIILSPDFEGRAVDQIEIEVLKEASFLAAGATSRNAVPVIADASPPCEVADHEALFDAAVEAANAYNAERADTFDETADFGSSRPAGADPELITQDTGSKPVALPWIAVAGFALVGAGVGLVLRRRFR